MDNISSIIAQLERQGTAIDRAISALKWVGAGSGSVPQKKHGMSAAARKRISEATKARWAAKRAAESTPEPKKSRFTAATKKRMRLAQRKRWAAVREEAEAAKRVAAKKAPPKKVVKNAAAKKSPVKKVITRAARKPTSEPVQAEATAATATTV